MGDRCYLELEIPNHEVEQFKTHFPHEFDEVTEGEHSTQFIDYQANYGWSEEIDAYIINTGATLLGWHDSGGNYGQYAVAGFNGTVEWVRMFEGAPCVHITFDSTGEPETPPKQMKDAQDYELVRRKAKRVIDGDKDFVSLQKIRNDSSMDSSVREMAEEILDHG